MYADLWPSVQLFLDCSRYWVKQIPPMGGKFIWECIDPTKAWVIIRDVEGLTGEAAKQAWRDLRTMESAALELLNDNG